MTLYAWCSYLRGYTVPILDMDMFVHMRTGKNTSEWNKLKIQNLNVYADAAFSILFISRIIYRVSAQWHARRQPLNLNLLLLHSSSPSSINLAEGSWWHTKYRQASCARGDRQAAGCAGSHGVPWPRLRAGRHPATLHHHHPAVWHIGKYDLPLLETARVYTLSWQHNIVPKYTRRGLDLSNNFQATESNEIPTVSASFSGTMPKNTPSFNTAPS